MPKHLWTVFCSKSILDRNTNNVSLIEVVEELTIGLTQGSAIPSDNPVVIPITASLVTLWVRNDPLSSESTVGRFYLIGPANQKLAEGSFNIDLEKHNRTRCFANTSAFPVQGAGTYQFVVEYQSTEGQWTEAGRLPIDVKYESGASDEKQA
jgi:hypothetical protein